MAKTSHNDKWQRQFCVTDHVRHKKGPVLYKIISIVFPKGRPEAITKITVWKPYCEIRKLHNELKNKHAALQIREEFPSLVRKKLFERLSDDDIKQQKDSILVLLNFVAHYPSLFTTDTFVKFFQSGFHLTDFENVSKDEDPLEDIKIMGQVLQSESSHSSDESHTSEISSSSKKSRTKTLNSLFHSKLKKEYPHTDGKHPPYWEEAVAHAEEALQQEILCNYEVAFAMYKTAIVCLLSGVQGDGNSANRMKVKEQTSHYLMRAEWIYNNHLVFQISEPSNENGKIPWRSKSQMKRYKIMDIVRSNLLVQDIVDNTLVVVKGVLKSSCPLDRSERCIVPKDIPFIVQLYGIHETDTTVYFVLEHVRYGRLWDHLQHYFYPGITADNLESEMSGVNDSSSNSVSSGGSIASINECNLSRLESSVYTTDTLSCESLSSHEETYFDLVEDYVRAKNQKLKEIQDFNERRKHMESRPVKKTASQVDLKSFGDDLYTRSQSLTDLARESEPDYYSSAMDDCKSDSILDDADGNLIGEEKTEKDGLSSSFDEIDTQQLLRNAQRLIESINETLLRGENAVEQNSTDEANVAEKAKPEECKEGDRCDVDVDMVQQKNDDKKCFKNNDEMTDVKENRCTEENAKKKNNDHCYTERKIKDKEMSDHLPVIPDIGGMEQPCSPMSESIPSITEEYSTTAVFQKEGLTEELVRKWATQLLIAIDSLHQQGIICRDLNPENILLSDNGSIKLTYFFRYPNVDPSLSNYAIERLYAAPEVNIFSTIYSSITFSADWWSYGAILYELITLQSLYDGHPWGINSHTVISIPERVSPEARSLLKNLLKYDYNERLGSGISGVDDIKAHPYFIGVTWDV